MRTDMILLAGLWLVSTLFAASVVWLWFVRAQRNRLQREMAKSQEQIQSMMSELHRLTTQVAIVNETKHGLETHFEQVQQRARETFESLAGQVLQKSNEQFLQLARKSFEGEQKNGLAQLEQRKQAIEGLIKPLGDVLAKTNLSIQALERARMESYGSLTKQVELMGAEQCRLRHETAQLVRALRKPNVRGQWGQVQLRRVAELAGMIPHCDFEEEYVVRVDGGVIRPDMVVRLPNRRTIVVDAKTPLDAFLESLECTKEQDRIALLERHADQLLSKVKELSAKRYSEQFERSPELVVMFIPGESFLYAALEQRPGLIEQAMEKMVVIATPSTLISLLKVIALGWQEEQIAQNAKRISELGRQLHERLRIALDHIQKVGSSLEAAVRQYNRFVGSLETRVMVSAKKLKDFGAGTARALPEELPKIEVVPRSSTNAVNPTTSQEIA